MIPLCGPKLLQSNGSTPGLVLEFKPSYHQNMFSLELDILIPLGVSKIYNSSLLVGHVVLDMLVKNLFPISTPVLVQTWCMKSILLQLHQSIWDTDFPRHNWENPLLGNGDPVLLKIPQTTEKWHLCRKQICITQWYWSHQCWHHRRHPRQSWERNHQSSCQDPWEQHSSRQGRRPDQGTVPTGHYTPGGHLTAEEAKVGKKRAFLLNFYFQIDHQESSPSDVIGNITALLGIDPANNCNNTNAKSMSTTSTSSAMSTLTTVTSTSLTTTLTLSTSTGNIIAINRSLDIIMESSLLCLCI